MSGVIGHLLHLDPGTATSRQLDSHRRVGQWIQRNFLDLVALHADKWHTDHLLRILLRQSRSTDETADNMKRCGGFIQASCRPSDGGLHRVMTGTQRALFCDRCLLPTLAMIPSN